MDGMDAGRDTDIVSVGTDRRVPYIMIMHSHVV